MRDRFSIDQVKQSLSSHGQARDRLRAACPLLQDLPAALRIMFRTQLGSPALEGCFDSLPSDMRRISSRHLHQPVHETKGLQWLLVSRVDGWMAMPELLTMAGPFRGMRADRSQLLFKLVRLVGLLQQLQLELPPPTSLRPFPSITTATRQALPIRTSLQLLK
jgi:hypothetical protein